MRDRTNRHGKPHGACASSHRRTGANSDRTGIQARTHDPAWRRGAATQPLPLVVDWFSRPTQRYRTSMIAVKAAPPIHSDGLMAKG